MYMQQSGQRKNAWYLHWTREGKGEGSEWFVHFLSTLSPQFPFLIQ